MDYITELSKEHSLAVTNRVAQAIGKDSSELKKIIDILYNEKAPLPVRASWVLTAIQDKQPELLEPFIPLFLDTIHRFTAEGIRRHIAYVLAEQEIDENYHGELLIQCYKLMNSPKESVAVKVHAMQAIANVAIKNPDLKKEFKAAIELQLPQTTAAFHARAKKVYKDLKL
jgi:hypothetical protein